MEDTQILDFIKKAVVERRILWSYHVNMRMEGRFISRDAIIISAENYEIIEKYHDNKYLPSFLVYTCYNDEIFHINIAVDEENNRVIIITAYRPDLFRGEADFKIRRSQK